MFYFINTWLQHFLCLLVSCSGSLGLVAAVSYVKDASFVYGKSHSVSSSPISLYWAFLHYFMSCVFNFNLHFTVYCTCSLSFSAVVSAFSQSGRFKNYSYPKANEWYLLTCVLRLFQVSIVKKNANIVLFLFGCLFCFQLYYVLYHKYVKILTSSYWNT